MTPRQMVDQLSRRVAALESAVTDADDISTRLRALELATTIRQVEENPSQMRAGEYAEVTAISSHTISLVRPGARDLWRQVIIRKTTDTTPNTLTVQAVGTSLDGTRDGTVTSAVNTILRIQAIPDGSGGAEWVSL